MNFFDLHCDTISKCFFKRKKSMLKNKYHIDIERGEATFGKWFQTFAFWMPDTINSDKAYDLFLKQYRYMEKFELPIYNRNFDSDFKAILMVEGGLLLGNDISRVDELKNKNIKMLTLTWNNENTIASGALANGGLKPFGKQVVRELEKKNIVVDVSHLNEESFWDVVKIAKKPFVATHSNAYNVCGHVRNLKADQIKEIKNVDGIIGLNFYKLFLEDNCRNGIDALMKHIDYFLKQDCEDVLSVGSDFDGADMPDDIKDITCVPKIKQHISKCFGEDIANKIMFENAKRFFDKTFN